jgi:uncharacterized membrane protein YphA (DoxX/SURF4 family)
VFFSYNPDGGIVSLSNQIANAGFPLPMFFAYFVAFIELFGGIVIALGFFTKVVSILLAAVVLVAFVTVHKFGIGSVGDIDMLAFFMLLTLTAAGPGRISLAERWYREDLSRIQVEKRKNNVPAQEEGMQVQ